MSKTKKEAVDGHMSEVMIGVLSSALAAVVTNPLEILRSKLMIDEEEMKLTYTKTSGKSRVRDVLRSIVMAGGGFKNLETGLIPALSYYTVTNGIRLGFFSSMEARGVLTKKHNNKDERSFIKSVAVATGGAVLGGFAANPLFVIKSRIQVDVGEGSPRKHPLLDTITYIYKSQGYKGFYKGVMKAVPIVVSGSIAQLVTFSYLKDWLKTSGKFRSNFEMAALSALGSSIVVVVVTNPIDNCLTILHIEERSNLKGYWDAFKHILASDGWMGFYRGGLLSLLRVVPHNLISLVVWDVLRMEHKERKEKKRRHEH